MLGNTFAQDAPNQANGILKNATIAGPLKILSNFYRLIEMSLINCKVELRLNEQSIVFYLEIVMIILISVCQKSRWQR